MEDKKIEKLFYNGESNFSNSCIVKIFLKNGIIDDKSSSALLICEKNINDLDKIDFNDFGYVILSSEIINDYKIANKINFFRSSENISFLEEGDVVELLSNNNLARLVILYRVRSDNNIIIATNHCNNKCIMCPQPIHITKDDDVNLSRIETIISMMNRQTKFLTITGGEPTLLKNGLVEILSFCKKYLPMTQIEILSNGRMFFYCSFVDAISSVGIKFLEVGVPLHSWNEKGHDQITLVPGSFVQTVTGIKNLANSNINVEIRVVIQKGNYLELTDIANFIIKEMPNVKRVSFIGMEMLGSAIKNSENIWVNYQEIGLNLKDSIFKLLTHGIKVNIYNIPLCKIDVDLRSLCVKSISDYKVRYLEECDSCKLKDECGGIFVSSKNFVKNEGVVAII